ncbi:unnamed protein product [Paramecium sonneborni]|uniref:Uncharacterized protein n=1 Tax=Paramecium sonneborni TaxID=65129 RepID=A0A8S1RRN7_9CILI|nr:unnamed protein product [Paramecium sonneborni]
MKIGKWIELDEEFYFDKQDTHDGQYNKNGKKVGRWDIMYCKPYEQEYKQMGNIVVVDHMIKKEIRQRLESGQIQMKGLT